MNVLITGGTGGIGSALVTAFSEADHSVWFTYHRSQQTAHGLASTHRHTTALALEQGNLESHQRLLSELPERVDILINNAALGSATVEREANERRAQDRKLFEVNALGVLWLIEDLLPRMHANGFGKIINISSVGGGIFHYPGFRLADGMSKAALTFLTRQLAAELVHAPIDVFAVCPGATDTPMFQASTLSALNEEAREALVRKLPKGRLIEPKEVAALCLYLAGKESQLLHGAVIDASLGLGVNPGCLSH